jgi:hypothetical protein
MIWLLLLRRHRESFKRWFAAPAAWWERLLAAVASAVVFAILGLVVRLAVAPLPLLPLSELLQTVLLWSGSGALTGVVLGLVFPKTMLCIAYPFSTLLDLEVGDVQVGDIEIKTRH